MFEAKKKFAVALAVGLVISCCGWGNSRGEWGCSSAAEASAADPGQTLTLTDDATAPSAIELARRPHHPPPPPPPPPRPGYGRPGYHHPPSPPHHPGYGRPGPGRPHHPPPPPPRPHRPHRW